jgi:hypothetical protein
MAREYFQPHLLSPPQDSLPDDVTVASAGGALRLRENSFSMVKDCTNTATARRIAR